MHSTVSPVVHLYLLKNKPKCLSFGLADTKFFSSDMLRESQQADGTLTKTVLRIELLPKRAKNGAKLSGAGSGLIAPSGTLYRRDNNVHFSMDFEGSTPDLRCKSSHAMRNSFNNGLEARFNWRLNSLNRCNLRIDENKSRAALSSDRLDISFAAMGRFPIKRVTSSSDDDCPSRSVIAGRRARRNLGL
mmetsp:Transcript_46784/g.98269  ORF Transcript_46784/g.98269 Transcript_46784/m.98269 type:complete len:189 (-) Transcript_46784:859-1425(-)